VRVVRIQTQPFKLDDANILMAENHSVGALTVFVGQVRDFNDGQEVSTLFLDHYPGMTEATLETIAQHAEARWSLGGTMIIHRVGELVAGEPIVLVAAASTHRHAAFEACQFMMDVLKTEAPFWKRENRPSGAHWVDARESDAAARARWLEGEAT
jgi:molybdopterin synthase catalytic subunit